jgi:hypothetical protein
LIRPAGPRLTVLAWLPVLPLRLAVLTRLAKWLAVLPGLALWLAVLTRLAVLTALLRVVGLLVDPGTAEAAAGPSPVLVEGPAMADPTGPVAAPAATAVAVRGCWGRWARSCVPSACPHRGRSRYQNYRTRTYRTRITGFGRRDHQMLR